VASWSPTAAAPAATRPRTRARVLAKPRKRVAGGALTIAISAILLARWALSSGPAIRSNSSVLVVTSTLSAPSAEVMPVETAATFSALST